MNTFDKCDLNVTLLDDQGQPGMLVFIPSNTSLINDKQTNRAELFKVPSGTGTWTVEYGGEECPESAVKAWDLPTRLSYEVQSGQIHYIYIGMMGAYIAQADPQKPLGGTGEFSMA